MKRNSRNLLDFAKTHYRHSKDRYREVASETSLNCRLALGWQGASLEKFFSSFCRIVRSFDLYEKQQGHGDKDKKELAYLADSKSAATRKVISYLVMYLYRHSSFPTSSMKESFSFAIRNDWIFCDRLMMSIWSFSILYSNSARLIFMSMFLRRRMGHLEFHTTDNNGPGLYCR